MFIRRHSIIITVLKILTKAILLLFKFFFLNLYAYYLNFLFIDTVSLFRLQCRQCGSTLEVRKMRARKGKLLFAITVEFSIERIFSSFAITHTILTNDSVQTYNYFY